MSDQQQQEWDRSYAFRKEKKKYKRIVTEGDSWFCYPIWSNMLDFVAQSNLFALCRCGESGRTLREIVDDGHYLKAVNSEKPAALLISGGGNDFVNHDFVFGIDGSGLLFNDYQLGMSASDVISKQKWMPKLDDLMGYYEKIVKRVGSLPIVTHGYANIVPNGEAAKYNGVTVAGPWIRRALLDRLVPESMHRAVAISMIADLNSRLEKFASVNKTLHYLDLRNAVADTDWANEIHPYSHGFSTMANVFLPVVEQVAGVTRQPVVVA